MPLGIVGFDTAPHGCLIIVSNLDFLVPCDLAAFSIPPYPPLTIFRKLEERGIAKGKAEGIAEGIAKGIAEGIAKATAETKAEIIRNMMAKNIAICDIAEMTGLAESEIKEYQ